MKTCAFSLFKCQGAGGVKDSQIDEMMETAKIKISDYNKYEFYYYPGVPLLINAKRESRIDIMGNKAKRIDIVTIELLE